MNGLSAPSASQMFDGIATRYDAINALLSFGRQGCWRSALERELPVQADSVLDLATGTAAVPLVIAGARSHIRVTGVDVSHGMLDIGRRKVSEAGMNDRITLAHEDITRLSFKNDAFDAASISFGLRNVPDVILVLSEAWRVLKPGGVFIVLEFSRPEGQLARAGHFVYVGHILPFIGGILSGKMSAYGHLTNSILSFPDPIRFSRMLRQTGFANITTTSMACGAVTLYRAVK